ncbi:HD family phosphohydrolase [Blastopirellula marina]|uniref:Metal-dependent phosphohydrolase n=1 Tax=Blastopirellula marina TaxID=124 RepID=A0A2S8GBT6_9BACT|nr:HDIG domain-containing metalloprotein [Blastopirellula marina]PQO41564.1 metal-dependent phosphohydrolase [Blastopirellula marina]
MPPHIKSKTRSDHVSSIVLKPGAVRRLIQQLQRPENAAMVALTVSAAVVLWAASVSWLPPFPFREDFVPPRDVVSRVDFAVPDPAGDQRARDAAAANARTVYENDPRPLEQMRGTLQSALNGIVSAKDYTPDVAEDWEQFLKAPAAPDETLPETEKRRLYDKFRTFYSKEGKLTALEQGVAAALSSFTKNGLMDTSAQAENKGNKAEVIVYPKGEPDSRRTVSISDLLIAQARNTLKKNLEIELSQLQEEESNAEVIDPIYYWLSSKLPGTLSKNEIATTNERQASIDKVPPVMRHIPSGEALAKGGVPLEGESLKLLQSEHQAYCDSLPLSKRVWRSMAIIGMFVALATLSGVYLAFKAPQVLMSVHNFLMFLSPVVGAVLISYWIDNAWRAELVPLMALGMLMAIVYRQELALLVSACAMLAVVFLVGEGLSTYVTIAAATATAILMTVQIRSRTKLIFVGVWAGVAAFATQVGVGVVVGQPLGLRLVEIAAWQAGWAIVTGFLLTGLLPFIEKTYGVLTDISLLELGDAAHPLLQELVRRAPGTYNHSINVASIAEAAADAIGANGLLARVGAYFHDIGKMMKPEYFIENQSGDGNRHASLLPAMSTLIIIAHVKDGADLARKHKLPRAIIDFIEQHHGTTLVEYFYREASRRNEKDPSSTEEVDESSYRYPGPKPQSKEAGVMMIADMIESASRTLVDPTPARIENLVEELTMKRLLDGQFDESGLTLSELRKIQDSVTKSLTAVYHGRVKYPSQQRA